MGSVNSLIFPSPQNSSYNANHPNLIHIPRINLHLNLVQTFENHNNAIPCIFLPSNDPSSSLLLYFHGNSEDAWQASSIFENIQSELNMHILIVEYPTYGLYRK